MNLKYVHIFFISLASVLSLGMLLWGLYNYRSTGELSDLAIAAVGVILLITLPFYGRWFWHKIQKLPEPAIIFALMTVGLFPMIPRLSSACAVCFKDPNSQLVKGAQAGVLVLGVIIYAMLLGIAAILFTWYRRSRTLQNI